LIFDGRMEIVVPFNYSIIISDTQIKTWGCYQSNLETYANNVTPEICAFITDDFICRKPSRACIKQYNKLKQVIIIED